MFSSGCLQNDETLKLVDMIYSAFKRKTCIVSLKVYEEIVHGMGEQQLRDLSYGAKVELMTLGLCKPFDVGIDEEDSKLD